MRKLIYHLMNSEERRKAISEVNQERINKSKKPRNLEIINKSKQSIFNKKPISYKLLISLFLPLLLLSAYASIWLYEFGYFSYFGILPDEIELNLLTGTSPSIFLLCTTVIFTIFLLLVFPEALYLLLGILFIYFIITFILFIYLVFKNLSLLQVILNFYFIFYIVITSIFFMVSFSLIVLNNYLGDIKNTKINLYILFFCCFSSAYLMSRMFWYFLSNIHYIDFPPVFIISITPLIIILLLIVIFTILIIFNIIISHYTDTKEQNKKFVSWIVLFIISPAILLFLSWGQKDAKESYELVSIRLIDMPKASSTSYVLIRHYPDKLILKDISLTQIQTIQNNASASENIKEKIHTAIIEAPTVIIQGTENVLIKEESLPTASPSTGQQ